MPRLLLIADVGGRATYHVGDEAMLGANLDGLARLFAGDLVATVVSADPEWTARHYGVRSVERLELPATGGADLVARAVEDAEGASPRFPAIAALASSDMLLVSGGGNLNTTWPHHLYERVALMRAALHLGKPFVVLGQTLGPRLLGPERQLLADVLPSAALLGVRELDSFRLALRLGVPVERLHYQLDDAAFLSEVRPVGLELPEAPWIAVTLAGPPRPASRRWADALATLHRVTRRPLVLVPHAAAPDDDAGLGATLAEGLDGPVHLLPLLDAREVAWVTRRAAMVVSSRYHPLVFGLSGQVPCLGLFGDDYTRVKLRGALRHAGLESWCLDLRHLGSAAFEEAADEVWQRRDEISAHLAGRQPTWRAMHASHWGRIAAVAGVCEDQAPRRIPPPAEWQPPAPKPGRSWASVAAMQAADGERALWLELELQEQRDVAQRYAQSLREVLRAREEELANVKALLGQREADLAALRGGAASLSTAGRAEPEPEEGTDHARGHDPRPRP